MKVNKKKWDKISLHEIGKVISGYAFKSSEFKDSGIPVIKIKNIRHGDVDLSNAQCVDDSRLALDEKYHVRYGDILISLTGSHLTQPDSVVGRVARYSIKNKEALLNQRAGKVIINSAASIDRRFLFYVLSSQEKMTEIALKAQGAASQANVSPSDVESLILDIPILNVQQKISAILFAYDDLIEKNIRRIQIFEEMAQRIYREWFIDYRFSGHEKIKFIDSQIGKIPEGWQVVTIGDVIDSIESGSRPKGGIDPHENGVPSIGAENILGLGLYEFDKEKYVSKSFFENMRRGIIKSGDVLLYKDGAKIGRKSMFRDGFPHDVCCVNEHAFILRTNSRCSQNYLYFYLDRPDVTQKIIGLNANAAQPGINQPGVKGLPILLPEKRLIDLFDAQTDPLMGLLFNLAKKNKCLREKRGILLPKLISGEVDVSEMDIAIRELANVA